MLAGASPWGKLGAVCSHQQLGGDPVESLGVPARDFPGRLVLLPLCGYGGTSSAAAAAPKQRDGPGS